MAVVAKIITDTFKCVELEAEKKYAGFKVYDFGKNLVEAKDFEDEAKRQGKFVWFTYCNQYGSYQNSHDNILLHADFSKLDIDQVMNYFCTNFSNASFSSSISLVAEHLVYKLNNLEFIGMLERLGISEFIKAMGYSTFSQYIADTISEILNPKQEVEFNVDTSDFNELIGYVEPIETTVNTTEIQQDLVTQINGEVNVIVDLTTRKELNNAIKKQISQTSKSYQQSEINQIKITDAEKALVGQIRQHQVEEESDILNNLGFSIDDVRNGNISEDDIKKLNDIIKGLQNVRDVLVAEQKIKNNQATKLLKGTEVLLPVVKKILAPIRKKALDSISKASNTVSKCFSKLLNYKENSKKFNIETNITADKVQACRWIKLNFKNIFKFDVSTVDSIHNYGTKTSKVTQQDFANSLSLLACL